jgi:hypothetical protein
MDGERHGGFDPQRGAEPVPFALSVFVDNEDVALAAVDADVVGAAAAVAGDLVAVLGGPFGPFARRVFAPFVARVRGVGLRLDAVAIRDHRVVDWEDVEHLPDL